MRIVNFFNIILIMFLAGCRKLDFQKEFTRVKDSTKNITGHEVELLRASEMPIFENGAKLLSEGMTRNQAIGIALQNNPELQAYFEMLGVARADLEQAGLYTNPDIHGFFWPPLQNSTMELETGIFFKISDLWQVPLRKNVEQDILEKTTFKILETILELMKETRIAYDNVLSLQMRFDIAKDILQQNIDLQDNIIYRQDFGLSSDLDKHLANITVSNAQLDLIDTENELSKSYIHLKKILGINPTQEQMKLTECIDDQIEIFKKSLPPLENLIECALVSRPEILYAHMKIKQFKDTIAYERSRIFKDFNAGVSFKQDFTGERGIGPSFEFSLPTFDQNQAQIAKAEFLLEQAKKELLATQLEIKQEVQKHYLDFITFGKGLEIYTDDLLPANTKALEYTNKFEEVMQITMITLLQTKTNLYQNKIKATEIFYNALNSFSQLERAVGKRLDCNQNA